MNEKQLVEEQTNAAKKAKTWEEVLKELPTFILEQQQQEKQSETQK